MPNSWGLFCHVRGTGEGGNGGGSKENVRGTVEGGSGGGSEKNGGVFTPLTFSIIKYLDF